MNLTDIFGPEGFCVSEYKKTPYEQASRAMNDNDLFPDKIIMDGKIHRFTTNGNYNDKSGWYIFFEDSITAGRFGDFKTGLDIKWCAEIDRNITVEDHLKIKAQMDNAKRLRDEEKAKKNQNAATVAKNIWDNATKEINHEYINNKKIKPFDIRQSGKDIICPIYDKDYNLTSLQFIDESGNKKFLSGGKIKGGFTTIGNFKDKVYVCEGYATGCTINQITNEIVFVSYSANNIVDVVKMIRKEFDNTSIVIIADNDESKTGEKYANEAADKYGAKVVLIPIVGMDANDYHNAGNDLKKILIEKKQWLMSADDFCNDRTPVSWFIKGWLQQKALMMIHGQSGSGKTFVILDMALTMASNKDEWSGHKINNANIVYLAGEGHHGLKSRITAWKNENDSDNINMWISKTGRDLDDLATLQKVIDDLRDLPIKPDMIIVDTLHRFMTGDENSSQDAGKMIKACAKIQDEFDCSIVLVHHTGVSDTAQERARGSSAWRAALDIEISIKKEDNDIIISQKKNKDSELMADKYFKLEKVYIDDWFDEDGDKISSAILKETDKKEPKKREVLFSEKRMIENAIIDSNFDRDEDGHFIVSKIFLRNYFTDIYSYSERNANRQIQKITFELIHNKIIESNKNYFKIINNDWHNKLIFLSQKLLT